MVGQLHITDQVVPINVHVNSQVSWLILRARVAIEFHLCDSVALRSKVKSAHTVCDNLASQVDGVLLLELFRVGNLIDLDVKFAAIECHELAAITHSGDRSDSIFSGI